MGKTINFKRLFAIWRAKAIKREAEAYFDAQVHHCCRISANNKTIAYRVYRVGAFGGPMIKQIDRPRFVELSENDDYVEIKDGYAYELTKTQR